MQETQLVLYDTEEHINTYLTAFLMQFGTHRLLKEDAVRYEVHHDLSLASSVIHPGTHVVHIDTGLYGRGSETDKFIERALDLAKDLHISAECSTIDSMTGHVLLHTYPGENPRFLKLVPTLIKDSTTEKMPKVHHLI